VLVPPKGCWLTSNPKNPKPEFNSSESKLRNLPTLIQTWNPFSHCLKAVLWAQSTFVSIDAYGLYDVNSPAGYNGWIETEWRRKQQFPKYTRSVEFCAGRGSLCTSFKKCFWNHHISVAQVFKTNCLGLLSKSHVLVYYYRLSNSQFEREFLDH
jgi:hypothetical protein